MQYLYLALGIIIGMLTEGWMRRKERYPSAAEIVKEMVEIDLNEFLHLPTPHQSFPDQVKDPHAHSIYGSQLRKIVLDGVTMIETKDSDVEYAKLREIETDPENVGKSLQLYIGETKRVDIIIEDKNASDIQ